MRDLEKPVRTVDPNDRHNDWRETHPAYATIGASRIQSMPGQYLAGSDFRHQGYVVISIETARRSRSLGSDHWYAGARDSIVEVALSEAQWATFVSTLNMGGGTPCTIQRRDGAHVPGIDAQEDRRAQMREEVADRQARGMEAIREAREALKTTPMTAKARKSLDDLMRAAEMQMGGNLDFVAEQFDRHAEKTVEKMKTEVSAYIAGAVQAAGLKALQGQSILELDEGGDMGD